MQCPVCGGKTRVTQTSMHYSGHKRRWRRCPSCGYSFITAQAYQPEVITDPLPCGYAGHLAKTQSIQTIE